MSALAHSTDSAALFPARYRSLITLLALTILGSIVSSLWLMPSRLERVAISIERGEQAVVSRELDRASTVPADPGEVRALVDVALTLGSPDAAASILKTFLTGQPRSVDALRLLLEVQRQRHLAREVAAIDEQIYAITGDVSALRDAADIYASRRMTSERIDALRRLAAANAASASEIAELTHRVADAGDGRGALALLLAWLAMPQAEPPPELIGLAAGLSAGQESGSAVAGQLGELIGRKGQIGLLHVLVQTYAERGHRELSLVAGHALGDNMAARPDVALVLAQLEALQGEFASARARLDRLERAGTLPAAGLPTLAELNLQAGDLPRAIEIIAPLPAEQVPEGLPHRLVETAFATGRRNLLAALRVEPIAASSPASGAVVALARGDRVRATALAKAALEAGADLADAGRALGPVLIAAGLEREAITRLASAAREGGMEDDTLSLLIDLAEAPHADKAALLQALRAQRDLSARASVVWAILAAKHGRGAEVATWVQATTPKLPAEALLDLLLIAVEQNNANLMQATAASLAGRSDLPAGWTQREITLTTHARDRLTAARLRDGLDLIGTSRNNAARDRVTALLAGAPGLAPAAQTVRLPPTHEAVAWLAASAAGGQHETVAARLSLLASIAPQQALDLLARRVQSDPQYFGPLYVVALIAAGHSGDAPATLHSLLTNMPPKRRDNLLQEILARLPPGDTLPVLRIAAAMTRRDDWMAAYDDALSRAGLLDELRSVLRARAAAAGNDATRLQALAARLIDLNDRRGAIEILRAAAIDKRPGAAEIEQLVFLWGPRADADAINWTRTRALAARPEDVPKWLQHLAYLGDPTAVVSAVESRPAILTSSGDSVRIYGAALIASHVQSKLDLHAAVAAASVSDTLLALAQLGLDTAQPRVAWHAARAAVAAAPQNPAALLLAAQAAASIRRSDDAAGFYTRLLALRPQSAEIYVDAADALITAKRPAEGRKVLELALTRFPGTPATLVDARLRGRTLMLLDRREEAIRLLNTWLTRYPEHPGLRADLLQARLDRSEHSQ